MFICERAREKQMNLLFQASETNTGFKTPQLAAEGDEQSESRVQGSPWGLKPFIFVIVRVCRKVTMEIRAISKYLRISPKKVRLVADVIRGLDVNTAEDQLKFITKKASHLIAKTLKSAVANAEHNFGLKKDNLYIKKILVNEGPALKRWMPRAFGRATPIKKRSSHIEIVLDEIKLGKVERKTSKIETLKAIDVPKKEKVSQPIELKETKPAELETKISETRPEIFDVRRKAGRRTMQHHDKLGLKKAGGALKRIFRRKAI